MKFGHFFVDRPIFASVISIIIVVVGLVSLTTLPVAQFPQIAPPTINVRATYPGANSQTIAETVASGCACRNIELPTATPTRRGEKSKARKAWGRRIGATALNGQPCALRAPG